MAFFLVISCNFIAATHLYGQDKKTNNQEYRIGNGDLLEILTWKEPDFSRENVLVRLDGKISFPLLDDIQATGKTPSKLKKDIEDSLKQYVSSPNVTVTVTSAASKRFYILGEVENTGEYPIVKDLTVLQAFALAGGFTEWASKKEIILFRKVGAKEKVIHVNYKEILKGKNFKSNIMIKADDTIIVP
ncbi:MAG: polysaccharide export protein [Desulfobacteraceae bacterium]|nr:polysaccharide export protein [Desulfobacteraceae bacterium]